ncbi:MAG TPA: hypothetical protein VE242_02470 [Chthoniobacterales bacterium]|jgi:hypothetical protein|nr:hypothetical protein [Chthoniobacterales bacterium]
MADPIENKGSLTERLEEDRQKMAVQVGELKEDYNVPARLRASVQKYPWPWLLGATLVGFLFSRLPARRKEVYLWADPLQKRPPQELHPAPAEKDDSRTTNKLWSLAKPIISTYVGRELYKRVRRPGVHAAGRSRSARDRR